MPREITPRQLYRFVAVADTSDQGPQMMGLVDLALPDYASFDCHFVIQRTLAPGNSMLKSGKIIIPIILVVF